jgi:hypothetical protein
MSDLKRKSNLETTYVKGQLRKDTFFGDFYVFNAINGDSKLICVEKLFNDKESILREIEVKKKRMLNKNENLVNLLDYSVEVQSNWCSTFYLLKCFYEFVDRNLILEILDRKKLTGDKNHFRMEELTHLMYQQVYANAFLQERSIHHGDISPSTIFITPSSEFKLAFRANDTMTSDRIQVDKAIKNEPLYLSPLFYEAVKQRSLDKLKHNQYKSDMFALGLSILQAGLMRPIQDIYSGSKFDYGRLEKHLIEFENTYDDNPLLFTSVRKMCDVNEEERPDFISLKSALPEYSVIKDYFEKVEAGVYEEEVQEEYSNANDSLKNYNPNSIPENEQWNGQYNYVDEVSGNYGSQFQDTHQIYPPSLGQHANFNRSISNKISNSSNQNSQNNSFNKPSSFANDFDHQTGSPNVVNSKQTEHYSRANVIPNDSQVKSLNATLSSTPNNEARLNSSKSNGFFNEDIFAPTSNTSRAAEAVKSSSINLQAREYAQVPEFIQSQVRYNPYQMPTVENESDYYFPEEEINNQYRVPQSQNMKRVDYSTAIPSRYQSIDKGSEQTTASVNSSNYTHSTIPYQSQMNNQPSRFAYQPQLSTISPYTPSYSNLNERASVPRPVISGFTGLTKYFDGKLYNELREEFNVLENGVVSKKIIIKYVPAEMNGNMSTRSMQSDQSSEAYLIKQYH